MYLLMKTLMAIWWIICTNSISVGLGLIDTDIPGNNFDQKKYIYKLMSPSSLISKSNLCHCHWQL